jgi:hypothetical protein
MNHSDISSGFLVDSLLVWTSRLALPIRTGDLSNPLHPDSVAGVKQVNEKITNDETGTTFLLAADGLYLIRRPAVEEEYDIHQWQLSHPG